MSKTDYYELLGVSKSASGDEIKKSYRSLAMKYHPDRNPGNKEAEQKFKTITEAYEILKDDQKKAAYDRYGHAAFENGGAGAGGGGGFSRGGGFESGGFSDIFEDFFGDFMGGGRSPQRNTKGSDLRYNLQISLEDAFSGKQQTIKFTASVGCDSCNSTGSADGKEPVSCAYCKGAGKVRIQQGLFTMERPCSSCGGSGKTIKNPCRSCHGHGRVNKERSLSVNIPAGVEEGTRIRLSGEGEAGQRGGSPGDLYIFISVKSHPFFAREGADLHCNVPIKMSIAALGGTIEVPTIEGLKAKVTIPAGAQTGDKFRLKSKGMSIMRSGSKGDMYIHILVETPINLTKRQRELLEEFNEIHSKDSSPKSEGFFKRVKDFWGELKD